MEIKRNKEKIEGQGERTRSQGFVGLILGWGLEACEELCGKRKQMKKQGSTWWYGGGMRRCKKQ